MCYVPKHEPGKVYYSDCDVCGQFHPEEWDGDCDHMQYSGEELDSMHGTEGWMLEAFTELVWVSDEDAEPIPLKAAA